MVMDPLTKRLSPKTFNEHVERMSIIDIMLKFYILYAFDTLSSFKYYFWYINASCFIMLVYIHERIR